MPFLSRERIVLAAFVALLLVAGCTSGSGAPQADGRDLPPNLVLISLDGFRWDYLDLYDAPTLDSLANLGARAERLIPVFPTKTFPTHYSIATGLYPDGHGIISNNMYDPEMDARFSLSNRAAVGDGRWWGGEPIWVTAEKQGLTAATFFWPGSEAPIQGVRPTYWFVFDGSVPGTARVDTVLAWLDLPPGERPAFITLYFEDADGPGHRFGPESREVAQAVQRVDGYLARLVAGLRERGLQDTVNLMIVSDHGMAERSPERVVVLEDHFNPARARVVDTSPVLMLYPEDGRGDATYEALKQHPHLDVYWKEDLPERFRLNHPRTPPLIAIATEGWEIGRRQRLETNPNSFLGGSHGYDPEAPSMAGIFAAHGPAFRNGVVVPPFNAVDLYNVMCEILGLVPAPNDGDPNVVGRLLAREPVASP